MKLYNFEYRLTTVRVLEVLILAEDRIDALNKLTKYCNVGRYPHADEWQLLRSLAPVDDVYAVKMG